MNGCTRLNCACASDETSDEKACGQDAQYGKRVVSTKQFALAHEQSRNPRTKLRPYFANEIRALSLFWLSHRAGRGAACGPDPLSKHAAGSGPDVPCHVPGFKAVHRGPRERHRCAG